MDLFDQISQEMQKAGEFIAEKATVAKDYTVATWNAAELRNKINNLYKAIGQAVYKAHKEDADTAEEINGYIEEIAALEAALAEKEEIRHDLKNQKACPSCKKGVAKDNSFCPHCGANLK